MIAMPHYCIKPKQVLFCQKSVSGKERFHCYWFWLILIPTRLLFCKMTSTWCHLNVSRVVLLKFSRTVHLHMTLMKLSNTGYVCHTCGMYICMPVLTLLLHMISRLFVGVGDDARSWGPPWVGHESSYFLSVNRNKKVIFVVVLFCLT